MKDANLVSNNVAYCVHKPSSLHMTRSLWWQMDYHGGKALPCLFSSLSFSCLGKLKSQGELINGININLKL